MQVGERTSDVMCMFPTYCERLHYDNRLLSLRPIQSQYCLLLCERCEERTTGKVDFVFTREINLSCIHFIIIIIIIVIIIIT
jgi:hypothetical protein